MNEEEDKWVDEGLGKPRVNLEVLSFILRDLLASLESNRGLNYFFWFKNIIFVKTVYLHGSKNIHKQ